MSLASSAPQTRFTQNRTVEEAERIFEQRIRDALDIYRRHHRQFVTRNCPVCGSSRYHARERFHDAYGVAQCDWCASLFVNPAPSLAALTDYYNNSECNKLLHAIYRKRTNKPGDFINDHRVVTVMGCLKQAGDPGDIRVLEIGCGSGSFLSKLRAAIESGSTPALSVQEYCGIDIDADAIARGEDPGLKLIHSSVEEFARIQSGSYDIVLCFELIEHLIDPSQFMQDSRRLLKPDGLMVLTTPNETGLEMVASDYNSYRLLAHSIFPPMHLNAFSTANITHFALRNEFAVLDI